jgi:transcription initiation factor TFIID subunit TAF12
MANTAAKKIQIFINFSEIENATKTPIRVRTKLPKISALRRSVLSTNAPIGIAKKSQGNNESAERRLINTGSSVNETANNGAARRKTPSAKLVIRLADQMREKSLPSELRVGTVGNPNYEG